MSALRPAITSAWRSCCAPRTIEYIWLLNNDTVVQPDAAQALIARMDATHAVGMCGTDRPLLLPARHAPGTQRPPLQPADRHLARASRAGTPRARAVRSRPCRPRDRFRPWRVARRVAPLRRDDRPDARGVLPLLRGGRLGVSQQWAVRDRLRPWRDRLSTRRAARSARAARRGSAASCPTII